MVVGHEGGASRPRNLTPWIGLVTAVAILVRAVAPAAVGDTVAAGVVVLDCLLIAFGPYCRGARPVRNHLGGTIGASFLVAAVVTPDTVHVAGGVRLTFLWFCLGYLTFIVWFVVMAWYVGRMLAVRALVDIVAGITASLLCMWSIADHARHVGAAEMASAGIYPLLDVVLLVLAAHLAVRLGTWVPAWWWVLAGLGVEVILDSLAALAAFQSRPAANAAVFDAVYLVAYGCLAAGAAHPSVVELSRPHRPVVGGPAPRNRTALTVGTLVPAVGALFLPTHDPQDVLVRSVAVSVLMVFLMVRLLLAMGDLSRAESASRAAATFDALTGLLNRGALYRELDARIAHRSPGRTTAVLFVDCDHFKHVNDTWGHQAGDALLRGLTARLDAALPPEVVVGRHGGDELVVIAEVTDAAEAVELTRHLQTLFDEPVQITPERRHRVTPSIGIALADSPQVRTADDLIACADEALYEAKARGRAQYVVFDDELRHRMATKVRLAEALRDALEHDLLTVDLQPIVDTAAAEPLVGWEALLRWRHQDLGDIPPGVFVAHAEEYGLIGDLGERALALACHEVAQRRRALGRDVVVSVNVSPAQLRSPDFVGRVRDVLAASTLPSQCLWLEITETLVVDKGPVVLERLTELRDMGVRIGIDDFGSGYASFSTLRRLRLDYVKLDRTLVEPLGGDAKARAQLGALLQVLRTFDVERVIAEGVENEEQQDALTGLGCTLAQGWHYGRPAPAEHPFAVRQAV